MGRNTRPGVVIFTGDKARLSSFYEALTGLAVRTADHDVTVLASEEFELVIHALPGEPPVGVPPVARENTYIKPFFPVTSLSEARQKAGALGGQLRPKTAEWGARGFVACEGLDPDGNVIQCREDAP